MAHDTSFYQGIAQQWEQKFHRARRFYWVLGALPVVFSAVAAFRPMDNKSWVWNAFAAAGSVTAALVAFWRPLERANRFNAAWIILKHALESYPDDPQKIVRAWLRGENIINREILAEYAPELAGRESSLSGPESKSSGA